MSASTQSSLVKVNEATQPAWPAARKMDLVLEGWLKHRPITELCREAGISPARYYEWRHQFIQAAQMGLAHPEAEHRALEERLGQLEAENAILQRRARVFRELCVVD
jgi:transposase-like protein